MIRAATEEDVPSILTMVQKAITLMNEAGNRQWNEHYPSARHFEDDVKEGSLFVLHKDGKLAASATISEMEHDEYDQIDWSSDAPALTIKRVIVSPDYWGRQLAGNLYDYAEVLARQKQIYYLKTDTFSKNHAALRLFDKCGYTFLQTWQESDRDDHLCYYEKFIKS